jgi:hypothetical protein
VLAVVVALAVEVEVQVEVEVDPQAELLEQLLRTVVLVEELLMVDLQAAAVRVSSSLLTLLPKYLKSII